MKLHYTTNSPFARKVLVCAHERGLAGAIERVVSNPWAEGNPVAAIGPLGKVPILVTDDGAALYDSPVICEYLDSLPGGAKLFPASGRERWQALRRQALGDGLLDAMIARRLESRRPDGERSAGWMERQRVVVGRCLDAMEGDAASMPDAPTIGHVAWLCALAHLDFRFADEDWRPGRPRLAAWYAAFNARESAQATIPHD